MLMLSHDKASIPRSSGINFVNNSMPLKISYTLSKIKKINSKRSCNDDLEWLRTVESALYTQVMFLDETCTYMTTRRGYPNTGVRSITWENTFAWKTLTIRENFFPFSSVWIKDLGKHAQLQHGKSDVASSIFIFFLNVWTSNAFLI